MDKVARAALLTAKGMDKTSENIADYVADLLRQGRAKEVTDDLMEQADPQRLMHHYKSGNTGMDLPMDKASRMERAAQMGFNTGNKLYHGSVRDFNSFIPSQSGKVGPGVYMTPNERKAGIFSGYEYDNNPRIEKLLNEGNEKSSQVYGLLATNKPATIKARQAVRTNESAYDDRAEHYRKKFDEMGFDGVSVADERTILDPTNIRSQFARFDPRLDHLAHLSASTGGAMELARAVMAKNRAGGQIAPSKYLPNVPRAVHADGGRVDDARAAFLAGNHPDVPEVVYHGTAPQVAYKGWTREIDPEQTQRNIDSHDFRTFRPSEYGNYGKGIYLSDSPKAASDFAQGIRADQKEVKPHGQVMKLHVSMKQPFTDDFLRHPDWIDYIKGALTKHYLPHDEDRNARDAFLKQLADGTATVRDMFVRDTPDGTLVNQFGQDDIHDTIRNSGFDGIIAHRPDGSKEYVAFHPTQIKSAIGNQGTFDPNDPDITKAGGGSVDFVKDNPGGDWLAKKQSYAFEYPRMKGIDGAITGWMGGKSDLFLPTHVLKSIEPLNNEKRVAGEPRFDDLMSSVSKEGFDPHQKGNKVVVAVNHRGKPFILEGNTRVAVAHAMGVPSVKAEVRYWNGAEEADGPMHPDKVLAMASNDPDITKSGGGEVVNLGKEKLVRSITKAASDVKSGAHQERMDQRAHKLHESGHLPLPIGTKVTPPQGWAMPSELHIHGYWQDILHPEQHGYKLKSENGDVYEVQHQMHSGQNPYVFGGGFKAYSGPVRNRAGYSDEAMAPRNPILQTRTPEQSDQLNKEYDQLFGTEPDITKAEGGSVTDTDEFRNWFGNSVTHTNGEPHVFYTGTSKDKDFTSFNVGRHGAWFTRDPAEASQYAEQNDSQGYKHEAGWKLTPTNTASRVIPAYVKAENPYTGDLPDEVLRSNYKAAQSDWFDTLRRKGHDAWVPARYNGDLVVALKEPQQIKSIFNNGKFDPNQKHMNKAGGGEVDDDGITAYHGSPHSFDSFDISKLGTGEGAQAYGHGLYFAGNEDIARHYRESLANGYSIDGKQYNATTTKAGAITSGHHAADALDRFKGDKQSAIDWLTGGGPTDKEAAKLLKNSKTIEPWYGHMYKVKLNVKPEELLDWDKPLSEQHQKVQRAIKEWNNWRPAAEKLPKEIIQGSGIEPNGSHIYHHIANIAQPNNGDLYGSNAKGQEFASGELQDMGLKGIRYLDAGSRDLSDGDATHNYVMFHHDPVQVTDKYEYGGTVGKEEGGEVGDNVVNLGFRRTMNAAMSDAPPQHVQDTLTKMSDRHEASRQAYMAAKADGVFDALPFGDKYRYTPTPNSTPMEVVGHRMLHVSGWGSKEPPKLVYQDHYPVVDMEPVGQPAYTRPYPVELLLGNPDKYQHISGKPRLVKRKGGTVDNALALTRRFTKDGTGATMALKPKGK